MVDAAGDGSPLARDGGLGIGVLNLGKGRTVAMLLLALALQTGAAPAPVSDEPPAVSAAKANRARIKTPPAYKIEPDTIVPSEAQLLGEHGEVGVAGIVGIDGRMTDARVTASSRSDRIDAAALDAARQAVFEPARDANGAPNAVYISVRFNFDNAASLDGKTFGTYRCGQFLRDQEWWRKTWPDGPPRDKFSNLLSGMVIVSAGTRPEMLRENAGRLDGIWRTTQDWCRSKPDAPVKDVFFAAARQR